MSTNKARATLLTMTLNNFKEQEIEDSSCSTSTTESFYPHGKAPASSFLPADGPIN